MAHVPLAPIRLAFAVIVLVGWAILACAPACARALPTPRAQPDAPAATAGQPRLIDADEIERSTIDSMLASPAWPRRALALLRLERFGCAESTERVVASLGDLHWRQRAFAVRAMAIRGGEPPDGWLDREEDPRVIRAALRAGWRGDANRVRRMVDLLSRSSSPSDQLLALELAAAAQDPSLERESGDLLTKLVARLDRTDAGTLTPRLRRLTGAPAMRLPHEWRNWIRRHRRTSDHLFPSLIADDHTPSAVAELPIDQFVALEQYMTQLSARRIDLAVLIDCTASMSGDLAQVQSGIDDLMDFIGAVSDRLRVAIIAYRDRNDPEFEVRPWDFTTDIAALRRALWSLSADGGGDRPEAVFPALRTAYAQLDWSADHARVLVLIGDAPPHIGLGARCIQMAELAAEQGLITHTIQARLRRDPAGSRTLDIEHFPEIAEAGNGRCVTLAEGASLVAEIAGLTVGERYRTELGEFYWLSLDLCR